RSLDYSLVHAPTDVEAERQSLLDGRFDGVLIDYLVKQDHVETLSRSNLPSLIINAEPRANIPAVRLDEHDSMKVATQHLVELGHERIVYVGMRAVDDLSIASTLEQIRRRSQAWQRLTSETPASRSWMQLDMPSTRYEDPRGAFDASGIAEVLARPAAQRPTAIVAYDWSAALVLVQGIEAIGFSVPGDISVVSLEDDNALRLQRKPITAIDLDFYQLGEDGAQRIASLIETHRDNMPDAVESTATKRVAPQGPVDMLVRSKLAVRESTTKPANA
ncbi:MAG: LacI family DNA-binding transcriptional regulator, partial [Planctomycetota bacterium]